MKTQHGIHCNPIHDKISAARKRHGARAAVWALLTSLYASGRDLDADHIVDELRRDDDAERVLRLGAMLAGDDGGLSDSLVGWVALRYQAAERSGNRDIVRHIENVIPRAAYPISEWKRRARPSPNLFDMSIDDAYAAAKNFLGEKRKAPALQGPVVYSFDDGWTVQDLNTKAMLVDEGDHQHICVGQDKNGYPQRVAAGEIKIYSLRDPEGSSHVTMTWSVKRKIYEASMEYNDEINSNDIRTKCAAFGRAMGMTTANLIAAKLIVGVDATLSGADLSDAYLEYADLSGANLSGANLSGANLRGSTLIGANLSRADLSGAELYDADLSEADLSEADLSDADMNGAALSRAKLRRANLSGAILQGAILYEADLSDADLSGAILESAAMESANLERAGLEGATYNSDTGWPNGWEERLEKLGAVLIDDDEDYEEEDEE